MATLAYPYSVRDSANTTADNRKTGLTPTVSNGKTLAASPATVLASTVAVAEVGAGDYVALYDAETNLDASFPIDWGASLSNPNDRYGTLILTRDAGRIVANLDAQVSTRLASLGATAPTGWLTGSVVGAGFVAAVQSGLATAANQGTLLSAVGTPAQAAQIPAGFSSIVISSGAFSADALANAPTGSGGGLSLAALQSELDARALTSTTTTLIATNLDARVSTRSSFAAPAFFSSLAINSSTGGVKIDLGQTGLAPRALDAVADASLTVGDALVAAISGAAGKASDPGTTYTVKTPSTGTVIRTFTLTLDGNGDPVARD